MLKTMDQIYERSGAMISESQRAKIPKKKMEMKWQILPKMRFLLKYASLNICSSARSLNAKVMGFFIGLRPSKVSNPTKWSVGQGVRAEVLLAAYAKSNYSRAKFAGISGTYPRAWRQ
jgi:hypothetical protein